MSNPKRHHFIPVMLSRMFTDSKGRLYFFDKEYPANGIQQSTPKNLFVRRHLYTQYNRGGNRDNAVELSLADLEGRVSPIIRKIISSARMQRIPELTTGEKMIWSLYFYIQWKRVPGVFDRIGSEYEWIAQVAREYGDVADIERMMRNARVESVVDPGHQVLPILMRKGLGIAVAKNSDTSFVIGSNPLVKLSHPGRSHLSDPSVEFWFPLAHDVAVTPSPEGADKLVVAEGSSIRAINTYIFEQSSVVAGCSIEQMTELTVAWAQAKANRSDATLSARG